MIIITGGAGFIGSNLVKALNARGERDILVVDDLQDGRKFHNLAGCDIADYLDKDEFLAAIEQDQHFGAVRAVLHQGACSDTTEWDGRYMMANNYSYSKTLLRWCLRHHVAFLYASSAAVYGGSDQFCVDPACEAPLNVYGYSKWQFDQYVRRHQPGFTSQVTGLRYFNVYGPGEAHKGSMASVAWHLHQQLLRGENPRLFGTHDGVPAGEQRRDFVHIDDVCKVILWFLDNPDKCGIYNVGTGQAESFNSVAQAVINFHGRGQIDYIPFPEHLKGCYQSFTEADINPLRLAGYKEAFINAAAGTERYLHRLNTQPIGLSP